MPLMEDGLTRESYVEVLTRLRSIVSAWEAGVAASPERPPDGFVRERNRLALLVEDLETLTGGDSVLDGCELPVFRGRAELMGAMYVMEGSRLGGQLIARHVERVLSLGPGEGTSYFRGFGERTGVMWKEFMERLREDVADEETDAVIAGAKTMFGVFGAWMGERVSS